MICMWGWYCLAHPDVVPHTAGPCPCCPVQWYDRVHGWLLDDLRDGVL